MENWPDFKTRDIISRSKHGRKIGWAFDIFFRKDEVNSTLNSIIEILKFKRNRFGNKFGSVFKI